MSRPLNDSVPVNHEPVAAVLRRERFARLRRLLRARGVAIVKVVYYAFEGRRLVTVCAVPDGGWRGRLWVPKNVRDQLVGFFVLLTTQRYPAWTGGDDTGGVYDWNLLTNTLEQRHTGPRIVHERTIVSGL